MKLSIEYRQAAINAIYLILVQGANYLVPLFMMFFLVDVYGVSGFGLYAFWYSVMLYVQTFVDYGFSFSGTREIASAEIAGNKSKISDIFTTITLAKLVLAVSIYIVVSILNCFFWDYNLLFFLVASAGVISALVPNWYFQGIQKIKKISLLNVFGKFIFCFLVYYFIDKNSELDEIFFYYCIGSLIPLIYGYWNTRSLISTEIITFDLGIIRKKLATQFSLGWHIFTTTALSMVLSNGGVFWLGIVASPSVVGAYAIVEKVVKALLGCFSPVFQAVYPLNSAKFSKSFYDGIRCALFSGLPLILICFFVSVLFYLFSPFITNLFQIKIENINYLFYLLCWMVLGISNNVLGIQILSASGFSARYAYSFNVAALVFVLMILFGTNSDPGMIVSHALVSAELALSILLSCNVIYLCFSKKLF